MQSKYSVRKPILPVGPSIAYIELTKGQYALIDRDDAEWLSQWNWFADWDRNTNQFRPKRNISLAPGKQVRVFMYRELLAASKMMQIDHVNRNTLDTRRCNLREATCQQNNLNRKMRTDNTSGYKGVYRECERGRGKGWKEWRAAINGRIIGYFFTPEEANQAYIAEAVRLHGEFRNHAA